MDYCWPNDNESNGIIFIKDDTYDKGERIENILKEINKK